MLPISIPIVPEQWDEQKQEFIPPKMQMLCLEHSLVSISEWEARWNKPFLSKDEKTVEEVLDYVKCMTLTPNVSSQAYKHLTHQNFAQINEYIEAPMSATKFYSDKISGRSREQITSELIYYWMIALNIPFECQTWHLNRLLTLIRICSIKNQPPKKHSRREIMSRNAALNAARRSKLHSKG